MKDLIDSLIFSGYLKTPRIIEAFKKIDRADFVPPDLLNEAYGNYPLPIGCGQTISQPLTVAFMFELLQPELGDKILDIGSGSGWTTALLAQIVGPRGKVYAVERIPELKDFGESNMAKYNFVSKGAVKFINADGSRGLPDVAPFDKIIAAAATEVIPPALKEQLKLKGRLVMPVKNSIYLVIKESENRFSEEEFPGFAFVPLVKD